MVGFPYDDVESWCAIYPPPVFVQQFEKVAEGFEHALALLRASVGADLDRLDRDQQLAFHSECGVAEAVGIHFRSTANQTRFVMARRAAAAAKTPEERQTQRTEMKRILNQEISLARRLHELQASDARLGFEASNQYFYVPMDLAEKILNCQDLLSRL